MLLKLQSHFWHLETPKKLKANHFIWVGEAWRAWRACCLSLQLTADSPSSTRRLSPSPYTMTRRPSNRDTSEDNSYLSQRLAAAKVLQKWEGDVKKEGEMLIRRLTNKLNNKNLGNSTLKSMSDTTFSQCSLLYQFISRKIFNCRIVMTFELFS